MSRNEDLLKAKLLMQKSLSHGAPSPKLSKMLEVLLDHFRMWAVVPFFLIIFVGAHILAIYHAMDCLV